MNALLFHATQLLAYKLWQESGSNADENWLRAQAEVHEDIAFVAYQVYAEWSATYGPNVPRPDADTIWFMAEQAYLPGTRGTGEPGMGV